jgi:Flp pilus assembly secretin CpaC
MTGLFDRGAPCAFAAALLLASPAAAGDFVKVVLDQAQVTKLPEHAATIVVGNPLIADVSVQAGGLMIVTGKGYGVTNIIALDRGGKVLNEYAVQVQGPVENVVVVYRGVNRESYSCTPNCERRITLGDTPEFFEVTLGQTGSRNQRAQGGGGGAAPR